MTPQRKKWRRNLSIIVTLLIVGGFFYLLGRETLSLKASVDEASAGAEEKWAHYAEPPVFDPKAPPVSIPRSSIRVVEEQERFVFETTPPAQTPDPDYFHRVHGIRIGEAKTASVSLDKGEIAVTYIGLVYPLGPPQSENPFWTGIFKMPGWIPIDLKEVPEGVRKRLPFPQTKAIGDAGGRCIVIFEDRGANVLRQREARIWNADTKTVASDRISGGGFGGRPHRISSQTFRIKTWHPARLSLVFDLHYDSSKPTKVPFPLPEVFEHDGLNIDVINQAPSWYSLHTRSFERKTQTVSIVNSTKLPGGDIWQESKNIKKPGFALWLNPRPYHRLDLFEVWLKTSDNKVIGNFGDIGSPTSPFDSPLAPNSFQSDRFLKESPDYLQIRRARKIDRVILPLGQVPVPWPMPDSGNLFDVIIPWAEIDDGGDCLDLIEAVTGWTIERNYMFYEDRNFASREIENLSVQELFKAACETYGYPKIDRKTRTMTFGQPNLYQKYQIWRYGGISMK